MKKMRDLNESYKETKWGFQLWVWLHCNLRTSENCLVMVLITMEMGWLESCRYVGAHASELLLEVKTHRDRASARQLVRRSLTSLSLCSEESPVLRRSYVHSK